LLTLVDLGELKAAYIFVSLSLSSLSLFFFLFMAGKRKKTIQSHCDLFKKMLSVQNIVFFMNDIVFLS